MSEHDRGTDRIGRRRKRVPTPQEKYEIFLQLVPDDAAIVETVRALHRL